MHNPTPYLVTFYSFIFPILHLPGLVIGFKPHIPDIPLSGNFKTYSVCTINDKPLFTMTIREYSELLRDLLSGIKIVDKAQLQPADTNLFLNLGQVCASLNITRQTMYGMTSRRTIPFMKFKIVLAILLIILCGIIPKGTIIL